MPSEPAEWKQQGTAGKALHVHCRLLHGLFGSRAHNSSFDVALSYECCLARRAMLAQRGRTESSRESSCRVRAIFCTLRAEYV